MCSLCFSLSCEQRKIFGRRRKVKTKPLFYRVFGQIEQFPSNEIVIEHIPTTKIEVEQFPTIYNKVHLKLDNDL